MRILFLSELFYPHGGGAEFATYLISKKLAEAGHKIRVITHRFIDEAELEATEDVQIIRKNLITSEKSAKYSLLLKYRIHKENWMRENLEWAQIVYIPRYWYNLISEIKKMGKPVIVHLHDYIAVCPVANLFDSNKSSTCASSTCSYSCIYNYERLKGSSIPYSALSSIVNSSIGRYMGQMIKKSDAILCVSNNQKDLITNIAPNLKEKISVVPNPLPAIDYIEIKSKGLAYFGGSSPFKGYQVLTQALEQLEDPNVKFKFTGFRNLKEIEKKDPRVEYYGWIKGSELENVYRSTHTVVIPSIIAEPAPYVVNEALLRGRIIIASDIGGIPEQVEGFEGCYLFSPGDSSQLATTIKDTLFISIDEAREIGYRNREKLLKKGQNDKILETFEALAKRVLL